MDDFETVNVFYTNANGIFNKLDELKICINLHGVDIICVTESKLTADHYDAEVSLPNFTMYRGDRNFKVDETDDALKTGGGSLI